MKYQSRFANLILFSPFSVTPIDSEVAKLLTKEEFFKSCYSNPRYQNLRLLQTDEQEISAEDNSVSYNELLDELYRQENAVNEFINWIKLDTLTDGNYSIIGHAGTGKTTYLHYLQYHYSDWNWNILNFETQTDCVYWGSCYYTRVNKCQAAFNKLCATVLQYISNILFASVDEDFFKCLQQLVNNYLRIISTSNINEDVLLEKIKEFLKINNGLNTKTKQTEISKLIAEYFNEMFVIDDYHKIFNILMDHFLLLIKCKSGDIKKPIIIAFDNIERFISDKDIYDSDLTDMERTISNYYNSSLLAKREIINSVKFIMVMRTSTVFKMGENVHSTDFLPNYIDISNWFDIDSIIDKKMKWYSEHGTDKVQISDLVMQITGDWRTCKNGEITGLKLFIDPLFNENKRLTIDFIGVILERANKNHIDKYESLWQENTELSRFAARSIIRGLILQELKNSDSLFEHLKTYSDGNSTGIGIARKILTYINNKSVLEQRKSIALKEIIQTIIGGGDVVQYLQDHESDLKLFAEVLYYMNSYNRRNNNWIQFLDLQINNFHDKVTLTNQDDLEELLLSNIDNISVSIMPAGEAYLKFIVPSFEFFSLRYNSNYEPLFATIPTDEDLAKLSQLNVKEKLKALKCIKLINHVKDMALKCVKQIVGRENILIVFDQRMKPKEHAIRILESHISYITNFIKYIENTKMMGSDYRLSQWFFLVAEIKSIRQCYIDTLKKII